LEISLLSPLTLGTCRYSQLTDRLTLDMDGGNISRMQGPAVQSDEMQHAPRLGLVISSMVHDEDGMPHGDSYFVDVMRVSKSQIYQNIIRNLIFSSGFSAKCVQNVEKI
jgi:hypothetical protein